MIVSYLQEWFVPGESDLFPIAVVLLVIGFLLGYFLSEGLAEGTRYIIAIAAAAAAFVPSIFYDRYAKRHEVLTYTVVRLF